MPFPYVFPFYFEASPLVYGVTVVVRIAFGDDMFEAAPTWTTLTGTDILEVHTMRGRKHELDRMEAGTCTIILDNASGDYYPDNAGGAYFPDIKVMTRVNVRAYYGGAGAVKDVFTGYVESWRPDWLGKSGKGPIVKVVCTDALKVFARALINNAGEAAEFSGARVGNVADEVNWPAGWRDIDTGQENLQATGAQANVNALEHLQKLQESELSLVYMAPDNDLQYEDRSHRTNAPHDSAELVFGDDGEGAGEDRYADIEYVLDEALLFNDARMTRTGGTEQTSSNATSQTAYGIRSISRTGLLNNTDVAAEILADYYAARFSEAVSRTKSITILPGRNPGSLWYKLLNYDVSTRVTIRLDQASIDKDYFIEGIANDWFAKTQKFSTRWQLSDATQDFSPLDAKEKTLIPNAAGDVTNLNNNGGATNWQSCETSDGDATYVDEDDETVENYDLYNLIASSIPVTATINNVKVYVYCRQTQGGAVADGYAKTKIKVGATEATGVLERLAGVGWTLFSTTYTASPDTAAAWTVAELDALQAGVALYPPLTGGVADGETRCTFVYVVVNYTPNW